MWNEIRDSVRSVTKKLDDYGGKYIKIRCYSDDKLTLNKTIKVPVMVLIVRAIFYENNKYYPQVFLNECLYEL